MWQHMFSMPVMFTVWRRELDSPLYGLMKYAGTTNCDLNTSALKSTDIHSRIEELKPTPSGSE